jgi:hypothetical protein
MRRDLPIKWLVIELPDGVRSKKGRIQGAGASGDQAGDGYDVLFAAQHCGAVYPTFSAWISHREHIISWSTKNDLTVVRCLKYKMSRDFNAGISDPHPEAIMQIDQTHFRDLESEPKVGRTN